METNIIFGPPGTGKTTELLNIVEWEIKQGTPIDKIAFVTFTKKGAEEGKERTLSRFNLEGKGDIPYFRTIHSLAFAGVNAKRNYMINRHNYYQFAKALGMHFTGFYSEELQGNDDKYLHYADMYRTNNKKSFDLLQEIDKNKAMFVMKNFAKFKKDLGIMDYTDLLENYIKQGVRCPVDVAIIDEAQDLTTLQWQFVWSAFAGCKRIYIAGDDDQALYEWAGADVETFLSIKGNYKVLSQSYRLPVSLVDYASCITDNIVNRVPKEYAGLDKEGFVYYKNRVDDVVIKPDETYMMLARNNIHLNMYKDYLNRMAIPYTVRGEAMFSKKDLDMIKLYEKVRKSRIVTKVDEVMLEPYLRSVNYKKQWFEIFNWPLVKINYIRQLAALGRLNNEPKVNVSTIHGVKGGEADNVILLSDITRQVMTHYNKQADSEHRCFYVGVTRAKKTVTVIKPTTKYSYKGL